MKIDRLIGILSILLQKEKVTAPYLAEKFEVSRRTINRDIETICQAGIPIVTTQGQNGGITIMDGYRLERTLLTSADMQAILTGLRSLDSVSGTNRYQQLMDKLSVGNSDVLASNNHIAIDLSTWHGSVLAPKIELLQAAIERKERVSFTYFAPKGSSKRKIEPGQLVFKWSSWYVWGYCCEKQAFRLFKLNRMIDLQITVEKYEARPVPLPDFSKGRRYAESISVLVRIEPGMKWRLIEEYGVNSFIEETDGTLLFSHEFSEKKNLFGWLFSFGEQAELLEPQNLRMELFKMSRKINQKYDE